MTDVLWDTPPPPARMRWACRLAPLKDAPGEWARVAFDLRTLVDAYCQASYLRRGRATGVDPTLWEFRSGRARDGLYGVWARYVGDGDG